MFDKPNQPPKPNAPSHQGHPGPGGMKKPTPEKHKKLNPADAKVTTQINEIMRRLRVLEERYSNLRKKNQLTDQNMLEDIKNVSDEIHVIQSTITELKKDINEVNHKIRLLNDEIAQSVNAIMKHLDSF